MLLIPCPHCGTRDQAEFSYGGPATKLPDLSAATADWHAQLHLREDKHAIDEYWFHEAGCECWFVLRRDLHSHRFGEHPPVPDTEAR